VLGAERHLVVENAAPIDYQNVLEAEPDPAVTTRLADFRARSDDFLGHVLH
jgi:hypothetical protein